MSPQKLTDKRKKTHGDFAKNAEISQALKRILSQGHGYTDIEKEALDMICLKLSRIASGHACHKDHWDDISGYAHLVSKQLK